MCCKMKKQSAWRVSFPPCRQRCEQCAFSLHQSYTSLLRSCPPAGCNETPHIVTMRVPREFLGRYWFPTPDSDIPNASSLPSLSCSSDATQSEGSARRPSSAGSKRGEGNALLSSGQLRVSASSSSYPGRPSRLHSQGLVATVSESRRPFRGKPSSRAPVLSMRIWSLALSVKACACGLGSYPAALKRFLDQIGSHRSQICMRESQIG
jgi:hypothetical protein